MEIKNKIKILLADDHPVIVLGIEHMINLTDDIKVVAKVKNGEDAVNFAENNEVDVAVLDIAMPVLNGLDAGEIIKTIKPEVKIIFVTVYDNEDYIKRARKIGAEGYILKEEAPEVILNVIRSVNQGFIEYRTGKFGFSDNYYPQIPKLTRRESEIFRLVAEGLTSQHIARDLSLSVRTVERHRLNIRRKLDLKSPVDFFKLAAQYKIIEPGIKKT